MKGEELTHIMVVYICGGTLLKMPVTKKAATKYFQAYLDAFNSDKDKLLNITNYKECEVFSVLVKEVAAIRIHKVGESVC